MSKNQFTGTASQPQSNRNANANFVNSIRTSTVGNDEEAGMAYGKNRGCLPLAVVMMIYSDFNELPRN